MVQVTRLNGESIVINSDLIQHLEAAPDTVIALTTGQCFRVRESADEVVRRIIAFRRELTAVPAIVPRADPEPDAAAG